MEKKKIFYGWWIVLGSVLVTCTMVPLVMSLFSKYILQITSEMGISRAQFTISNTIIQTIGIFISPFVAKKLATGNMRLWQSASVVLFALAYASYSLAQNVFHLYISAFFVGIFYQLATLIPISMMVTNWFIKKRGLAMSIAMAGIGLGGFIFSPLVTNFLMNFGWRTTYQIMALIVLVVALPVTLFIFKRSPADVGMKPYGADEEVSTKAKSEGGFITLSVTDSRKKLFFWVLVFGIFCNGIINSGALGQFPPALEELHGPALQATIISLYSIVGIVGKLLLGWINDKFGVVVSSIFGCTTFALAFVFMLGGSNANMLYIMALMFGMGNAIGTVTPPLITAAIYGHEKYGEAYGFVNSATQVGLATGSLLVAQVFDMTGSYQPAWILLLVLTIATLISWIFAYANSRKYCKA